MVRKSWVIWPLAAFGAVLAILLSSQLALAHGSNTSVQASMNHGVQWGNITDTGFTVAWITDAAIPGSGTVVYGLSPTTTSYHVNEGPAPSGARGDIHVVQVANLTPSTTYYFAVQAGGSQDNNNGDYYEVKTGPTLSGQVTNRTVSGSVTLSDGTTPASGALISLKVLDNSNLNGSPSSTSATLMAVTNAGTWSIVLSPRTADNNSWFNFSTNGSNDFIQYSVEAASLGDAGIQTASLLLDGTSHLTVPKVALTASAATDTPAPTATSTTTPTITLTSTTTQTATPTSTSTSERVSESVQVTLSPTVTPQTVTESNSPTSTVTVSAGIVDQGPPPAIEPIPVVPLSSPTARPQLLVATPNPRPFVATPAQSPTRVATIVPPQAPSTLTPSFVLPRFPFVSTPVGLGVGDVHPTPAGTVSPVITPSLVSTPVEGTSVGHKPVAASDPLPPLALTLLAAGLAVVGIGVALVSIGVSRNLRNS
jgi:hypothetical protein